MLYYWSVFIFAELLLLVDFVLIGDKLDADEVRSLVKFGLSFFFRAYLFQIEPSRTIILFCFIR